MYSIISKSGLSLLLCCIPAIQGEVFSSFAHLTTVIDGQKYLAEELKQFVQNERTKLDKIDR